MQSFARSASSLTHFKVWLLLFSYLRARLDFAAQPPLPRYTLTPVLQTLICLQTWHCSSLSSIAVHQSTYGQIVAPHIKCIVVVCLFR